MFLFIENVVIVLNKVAANIRFGFCKNFAHQFDSLMHASLDCSLTFAYAYLTLSSPHIILHHYLSLTIDHIHIWRSRSQVVADHSKPDTLEDLL